MANEQENLQPEGNTNPDHPKHHTWSDIIREESEKLNTEFPLSGGETEEDLSGPAKEPGENPPAERPHHTLMERIKETFEQLDTEFPLSGGETEEDFEESDDKEEGEEKA